MYLLLDDCSTRKIAQKFDTEHEEFVLQPQALELTEKLIHHLDEPFGDFSIFPTYLVSKMARNHVKVILSGDGGDELFAGYEHYQAQKLAHFPFLKPVSAILPGIVRKFPPSPKKKGLWNKLKDNSSIATLIFGDSIFTQALIVIVESTFDNLII